MAVADSMSTIFCKILNDRIIEFIKTKNCWSPNQNGFMEKCRTDDNIMILHTLFQKYVKNKKVKLYTAFIDFRKFFDCINRSSLLYKPQKCGITSQIYNVIKGAYTGRQYSVKTGMGNTESFVSSSGVKQGCNLSPTLSNIYQNDIHDIFTEGCDPVKLGDIIFSTVSWADDLVTISKGRSGLQNCLNKLQEYCDKWQLEINVSKTKLMVLSIGCSQLKDIHINGEALECVSNY